MATAIDKERSKDQSALSTRAIIVHFLTIASDVHNSPSRSVAALRLSGTTAETGPLLSVLSAALQLHVTCIYNPCSSRIPHLLISHLTSVTNTLLLCREPESC